MRAFFLRRHFWADLRFYKSLRSFRSILGSSSDKWISPLGRLTWMSSTGFWFVLPLLLVGADLTARYTVGAHFIWMMFASGFVHASDSKSFDSRRCRFCSGMGSGASQFFLPRLPRSVTKVDLLSSLLEASKALS